MTLTLFFTDKAVPVCAGVVVPERRGRKDGATVLVMSVVVRLAFNKRKFQSNLKKDFIVLCL